MYFRGLLKGAALAVSLIALPALADQSTTMVQQEFTDRGLDGCLKCHSEEGDAPVVSVLHTAHFVTGDPNTPAEQKACESCHGPSSEHAAKYDDDSQRPAPSVNYGPNMPKSSPESRNQACLSCHEQGIVMNWAGSAHDVDDVVCSDCHSSHTNRDPALAKKDEADVCYSCHKNTRIEANKPHRHPIREGKVTCSDCHNPHGSPTELSLKKATLNDTCYECHAEKRGPFLWEHQPVQENCVECHYAHGGNNERLLKVARPFLCQQCHTENSHQGTFRDGGDLGSTGTSSIIAGKACSQCHSQVHGSNHARGSKLLR
ncbi:DmsE family decaheme c-type cytochrome [Motiliproteus sediminis]|uniref:DmsE family decaheme c-type cytochrome n=1 Tax=Motiliproteus sediminis TaxID=1468178 RepID=UPI001AF00303|nr:DmsE family decaheme c-type cytochrome [Motiliproteus sediminis]